MLKNIGWLEHSGQVAAFHDRGLRPGERWGDRIKGELAASELIIALVSPHFVGSRYCCMDELQPAIERQGAGVADLMPIVCDHVDLGPLAAHQCLPQDENNDVKPLCDWPNPNLPLARCAAKVRALVEARRPPPSPAATTRRRVSRRAIAGRGWTSPSFSAPPRGGSPRVQPPPVWCIAADVSTDTDSILRSR